MVSSEGSCGVRSRCEVRPGKGRAEATAGRSLRKERGNGSLCHLPPTYLRPWTKRGKPPLASLRHVLQVDFLLD